HAAYCAQPRRSDLLAGLDQKDRVETKPTTHLQHQFERRHVDRVLTLIVGGAATVEPLAHRFEFPGRKAFMPLRLEAADDIAMAVAKDGRRGTRPAPLGDQHRTAVHGIVDQLARKPEPRKGRRDLISEIGAQHRRTLLDLALGRDRNAASKIGGKTALVEISFGGGDGGGAAHNLSRRRRRAGPSFRPGIPSTITPAKIAETGTGEE